LSSLTRVKPISMRRKEGKSIEREILCNKNGCKLHKTQMKKALAFFFFVYYHNRIMFEYFVFVQLDKITGVFIIIMWFKKTLFKFLFLMYEPQTCVMIDKASCWVVYKQFLIVIKIMDEKYSIIRVILASINHVNTTSSVSYNLESKSLNIASHHFCSFSSAIEQRPHLLLSLPNPSRSEVHPLCQRVAPRSQAFEPLAEHNLRSQGLRFRTGQSRGSRY